MTPFFALFPWLLSIYLMFQTTGAGFWAALILMLWLTPLTDGMVRFLDRVFGLE